MSDALLPVIWYCIICAELGLYVLLDGANLGIGIISLFSQEESSRSRTMSVLGPIWNANETWLLVAVGSLFGAFPEAYSIGLNALYVPGVIALLGIIGRAVSFEFHAYAHDRRAWSRIFGVSSLLLAAGHGFLLGGLLSGIAVQNGVFAGTLWDWFNPLSCIITIGIVFSYLVLGYAYLLSRAGSGEREVVFSRILEAALVVFITLFAATFMLPGVHYIFFERWSTPPAMYILYTVAFFIAALSLALGAELWHRRHPERIYWYCLGIFSLGALGMLVGTYPYLLPPAVSLFEAASPAATLRFMLYGLGPLLPVILAYHYYLHRVFSGSPSQNGSY